MFNISVNVFILMTSFELPNLGVGVVMRKKNGLFSSGSRSKDCLVKINNKMLVCFQGQ